MKDGGLAGGEGYFRMDTDYIFVRRYVNMGLKRHPEHMVEFYEWAPGTEPCSVPAILALQCVQCHVLGMELSLNDDLVMVPARWITVD